MESAANHRPQLFPKGPLKGTPHARALCSAAEADGVVYEVGIHRGAAPAPV